MPLTRLQFSVTAQGKVSNGEQKRSVRLTVTVSIPNNLDFRNTTASGMIALGRSQQSLLKESLVLLCGPGRFHTMPADVERLVSDGIDVCFRIRFLPACCSQNNRHMVEHNAPYRGMWKNMNALGFASLRVAGVNWSTP